MMEKNELIFLDYPCTVVVCDRHKHEEGDLKVYASINKSNVQVDFWGKEWDFIGDIQWKNRESLTMGEKKRIMKFAVNMKIRNLDQIARIVSYRNWCRKRYANK